jgi:hypothetical protein
MRLSCITNDSAKSTGERVGERVRVAPEALGLDGLSLCVATVQGGDISFAFWKSSNSIFGPRQNGVKATGVSSWLEQARGLTMHALGGFEVFARDSLARLTFRPRRL